MIKMWQCKRCKHSISMPYTGHVSVCPKCEKITPSDFCYCGGRILYKGENGTCKRCGQLS